MDALVVSAAGGAAMVAAGLIAYCLYRTPRRAFLTAAMLGAVTGIAVAYILFQTIGLPLLDLESGPPLWGVLLFWVSGGALTGASLALAAMACSLGGNVQKEHARFGWLFGTLLGLVLIVGILFLLPKLSRYLPLELLTIIYLHILLITSSLGAILGSERLDFQMLPSKTRARMWPVIPLAIAAVFGAYNGLALVEHTFHARSVEDLVAMENVDGLLYKLSHGNPDERPMAATALGYGAFRDESRVERALAEAILSADENIASAAATALQGFTGPDAVIAFGRALYHSSDSVRYQAASALSRMALDGDPGAASLLQTALQDEHRQIRLVAERGLQKLYRVLAGEYPLKAGADVAVRKLANMGLEAQIATITDGSRQTYAVYLGSYPNPLDAENLLTQAGMMGVEARLVSPD